MLCYAMLAYWSFPWYCNEESVVPKFEKRRSHRGSKQPGPQSLLHPMNKAMLKSPNLATTSSPPATTGEQQSGKSSE